MTKVGTVFVGIDAAEAKHAVVVAEPSRSGEFRYTGKIDAAADAVRKLLTRLAWGPGADRRRKFLILLAQKRPGVARINRRHPVHYDTAPN